MLLALALVAGACTTPIPIGDWGTTRFAPGGFAYEVRQDGVVVDSGGGVVDFAINRYSQGGGQRNFGGTFTTRPGFDGPEGQYTYGIVAEEVSCCGTYPRRLSVTTPDGSITIDTGSNWVFTEYISPSDPENPCPEGNGIYLSSNGPANGDPSTDVTIELLVCDLPLKVALTHI